MIVGNRTPLYQQHVDAGARMVDFGGWDMPIQYRSVIEEHHAVRQRAGVFDVSHMTVVDVDGTEARDGLRYLLANDIDRLGDGQALYTGMLNERGGVVDDLIVYRRGSAYRMVVNCATREKDLAWMQKHLADHDLSLTERPELAILAVQGPEALDSVCRILPEASAAIRALGNFHATDHGDWFIARTGYTGENGVEIILPGDEAASLWQQLLAQGVEPIGLGARDTLRLEAGMNLYGQDMDEDVSPLAANMGWTIAWEPADRMFLGRDALQTEREAGPKLKLVGLLLESRGVMRAGQRLICTLTDGGKADGIITSGSFSPTLKHSIALARIPANTLSCEVDMRGRPTPVRLVKPGFVRHGKDVTQDLSKKL